MKKSLLLLGAALLMTASAMAQTYTNTREKAGAPASVSAATFNYAAETGGDPLYLWNVKYGGFYTHIYKGGQGYWETRAAAVDTIGAQVVFTRENPQNAEAEQGSEWIDAAGNTDIYLFTSIVSSKGDQQMCSFADAWDGIYTDWNAQTNRYWHVKQNGQYLNLSIAKVNEVTVDWDQYDLCVRALEIDPDKRVYLNQPSEEVYNEETGEYELVERIELGETVGTDWAIVTPETYEAYIVEAKEQNTLYALGNQLAALLNSAVADTDDDIRPYLDTQIQILNDNNATAEQLQAAIDAIPDIVVEYKAATVTPDNPANFTTKINNPDFTNANLGGWQGGNWGRGGREADAAEHWRSTFDHWQDLSGLPEGVYKLVVDGFDRIQDNHDADYVAWKNGETGHARLYVGCESFGEFESPMKPASAGGDTESHMSESNGQDTDHVLDDGSHWYAPNSMYGFVTWLEYWQTQVPPKRPYGTEAYGAVKEGEMLRIGARNTVSDEWVIVDNFELWYLGNTLEAYLKWAEQVNVPELDATKYYGQPEVDYYNTIRNNLTNATTKEAVMDAVKNVAVAEDTIAQSNTLYEQFVAEVDGFEAWLTESGVNQYTTECGLIESYMTEYVEPGADFPNGSASYILDYQNGAKIGTLSVEQMTAELEFINQMKIDALNAGFEKGSSLTHLIVNPDFDQTPAGKGWTFRYNQTGNKNLRGGNSSNYCAEVWNSNFDLYQDITSDLLTPGLYKVTLRAFQRTGSNAVAWQAWLDGTAEVTAEVYFNEFATPVRNLQSVQYKSKMGNHRAEATHEVDGVTVYTLDDMGGASNAFSLPDTYTDYLHYGTEENVPANFKQDVFGLITPEEAGKITLGIRCNSHLDDGWVLWDKFEITYMAKDAAGLKQVIENYLNRDANIDPINCFEDDYNNWDAAMLASSKNGGYKNWPADANGDSNDLYDLLIQLATAYNACADAPAVIEEFEGILTELEDYIVDNPIPTSLYNEIDSWCSDKRDELDPAGDGSMPPMGSLAECKENIQTAKDYLAQAKESSIDWDTLPVDVTNLCIVNPRYAEGNNGWSENGPNDHQYNAAECYQNTFDVHQTITLPKDGYYRLSVRGFERLGWAEDDWTVHQEGLWAANTNAYLYANVGEDTYSHHIHQLADGAVTTEDQSKFSGNWVDLEGGTMHVTNNMQGASSFMYYYENDPDNKMEDPITGELVVKDPTAGYFFNQIFFNAPKGDIVIGLTKPTRSYNSGDWAIWGDWQLWYFGTEVPVGIEDIQNNNVIAAPVQRSVYTLGGAKTNQLQRGFNIVRTIDGEGNVKVQKIFVK